MLLWEVSITVISSFGQVEAEVLVALVGIVDDQALFVFEAVFEDVVSDEVSDTHQ